MGVQLAIGEQATTVYADPRQVRNAAEGRGRGGPRAEHRPEQDLPAAARQEAELRLRRSGRPTRSVPPLSSGAGSPGIDFYSGGAALLPAAHRRVAGARLRRRRQQRPRRAGSSASTATSRASPGRRRSCATRSGARSTSSSSTPEQPGRDVFLTLDHTLQAKVESVLRTTVAKWHATRRHGDRARSTRPAACSRWRSRRASTRTTSPEGAELDPAEPRGHRHLRAGLDVQGRHLRGCAHGPGRHPELRPSRSPPIDRGRRPHDRRGRAAADRDDDGRGDARPVVERRHDHARRNCSARSGWPRGSRGSASGDRPGSTSPARAPGSSCRCDTWSGLDDRQRPDRPGDRGDADPDGRDVRRARQPRRLGRAAPRRPRPWAAHRAPKYGTGVLVSPPSRSEVIGMLQGVVSAEGTGERGRRARLPRRRQDRHGREARRAAAATRTRTTSPRSSGSSRRARRGSSSSSRSTSRRARSSAASSRRRRSATSRGSRSSTSTSRRTTSRRSRTRTPARRRRASRGLAL